MVFLPDSEKERRLHAAHKYIESDPSGALFSKDDLRISSKTYYYVPSEYMHKSVNDLPEEVMRLMAHQGHRRRSSRDNMISMSTRKDSLQGLLSNVGSPIFDGLVADDFLSGLQQAPVEQQPAYNNINHVNMAQAPVEQQPAYNNVNHINMTQAPVEQQPAYKHVNHINMAQAPVEQQPMMYDTPNYIHMAQTPITQPAYHLDNINMMPPVYNNNIHAAQVPVHTQAPLMPTTDRFEQIMAMMRDMRTNEQREVENLRKELAASKRRIAELEQDALSFHEISQIMKRKRMA